MGFLDPPEWNYASEHPSKRLPANEDERRIYVKMHDGCLHDMWKRFTDTEGKRYAKCDSCGASTWIGDEANDRRDATPVLTDAEVRDRWASGISSSRYDDVIANELLREIEAAGWHCMLHTKGDQFACSMEKGSERIVSAAHKIRAAAITEAAGLVVKGKWPR